MKNKILQFISLVAAGMIVEHARQFTIDGFPVYMVK